jgi:hypothetical protein
LSINQEKTKYLEINAKRNSIDRNTNVKLGQHNFERVQTFSFLGLLINDNNINSEEILTRIKKGNKAFFMNKKLLLLKLIGKQSKIKINKYIYIYIYIHCLSVVSVVCCQVEVSATS